MKTISIPNEVFAEILVDVKTLIDDVGLVLDVKIKKRIQDIETNSVKSKTEQELNDYFNNRLTIIS